MSQASRQAQSQGSSAQRELGAAEALTEVLLQPLGAGSEEEDEAEPSFTADVVPGFVGMLVDITVLRKDVALLGSLIDFFVGLDVSLLSEAVLRGSLRELFKLAAGVDAEWNKAVVRGFVKLVRRLFETQEGLAEKAVHAQRISKIALQPARVSQTTLRDRILASQTLMTPYGEGQIVEGVGGESIKVELAWGTLFCTQEMADEWSARDPSNDVRWNTLSDDEGDDATVDGFVDDSVDEGVEVAQPLQYVEQVVEPLLGVINGVDFLVRGLITVLRRSRVGLGKEEVSQALNALDDTLRWARGVRVKGDEGGGNGGGGAGEDVDDESDGELVECFARARQGGIWTSEGEVCTGGEALLISQESACVAARIDLLVALTVDKDNGAAGFADYVKDEVKKAFLDTLQTYRDMDARFRGGEEGGVAWWLISHGTVVEEMLSVLVADKELRSEGEVKSLLCDLIVIDSEAVRKVLAQVVRTIL